LLYQQLVLLHLRYLRHRLLREHPHLFVQLFHIPCRDILVLYFLDFVHCRL
jgi:hypothetical protein